MHGSRFLPDLEKADSMRHLRKLGMKNLMLDQWWIYPLEMVIFHSYVSLPEGINFGFVTYGKKKNGKENRCIFLMFDILESYPNPLKHKTTLAAIVFDPRCISIAGFMEDTIPGFQSSDGKNSRLGR